MFIQQVSQVPITIFFGNLRIAIPKLMIDDWVKWGSELDAKRKQESTITLTPQERFRLMNYYTWMPTTLEDMKTMVETPIGFTRVLRTCLQRARVTGIRKDATKNDWEDETPNRKVTAEEVKQVMTMSVTSDLVLLAQELSDIHDTSKPSNQQQQDEANKDQDQDEAEDQPEDDADPLGESNPLGVAT